jgi:26S proteasome regulatory subunit N11
LNLSREKPVSSLRFQNATCYRYIKGLADRYEKAVVEEDQLTKNELLVKNVGRQDAKKHLSENVTKLMSDNIVQTLGAMLDTICF